MEFICKDVNSAWHFNPEDGKYYRIYEGKKQYSVISGHNLPDPEQLLASRIRQNVINGKTPDIDTIKPTNAVYKLYEHYQKTLVK